MAFDNKSALNHAIRYLTQVAERRAAGGWLQPKERERQQRDAMRAEEKQARQAEREQKEAKREEEKQQKLLSKQYPTHYMPNVGRQVMNIGGVPDQPQRQLSPMGFYSAAAERAQTLQPSGDAVQMVNALKNTQGIKTEELQNAGLIDQSGNVHPDWAGRGKVTRDELVSHLQGQMPQVEETVLGGETPRIKELKNQMSQMAENDPRYFNLEQELLFEQTNSGTKYKNYTLPGGENYREVLLKLPHEKKQRVGVTSTGQIFTEEELSDPIVRKTAEKIGLTMEDRMMPTMQPFYSPHWKDDPNVLAHIRMSDRTGPNGEKILHVEELQSDWGQKGKKEGFKSDPIDLAPFEKANEEARINAINANRNMIERESNGRFNSLTNVLNSGDNALLERVRSLRSTDPELLAAQNQAVEAERALTEARNKNRSGVPSAPYVTSTEGWTDLALKRVLKEAAEGGYDKVVWTPGAEQAERYNLKNHVKELFYDANKKYLTYADVNGGWIDHPNPVKPEDLPEIIGKEAAQQLLSKTNQSDNTYSMKTEDLTFGGEGMKGYYDSIVPKRLQNLAKKHDKNAKLGYTETHHRGQVSNAPMSYTLPSLDITPAMRESILRGQSAYKRGGAVSKRHPALSIAGTHIREEEHGEPMFTGRL